MLHNAGKDTNVKRDKASMTKMHRRWTINRFTKDHDLLRKTWNKCLMRYRAVFDIYNTFSFAVMNHAITPYVNLNSSLTMMKTILKFDILLTLKLK
jgi:hypothetical protein